VRGRDSELARAQTDARTTLSRRAVVTGIGVTVAAALALVGVLAYALARDPAAEPGAPAPVSAATLAEAFDVPLQTLDGRRLLLRDHAAGPVFVYFWASWCEPCKAEAQLIERLAPEYLPRGYTFLGINIWDQEADARSFAARYALSFPLARDPDGAVYLAFGVERLPMAFFLRPGLELERRVLGELREPALRAALEAIGGPS
jgi:thiol-disulfide isomerase/thioredoxin